MASPQDAQFGPGIFVIGESHNVYIQGLTDGRLVCGGEQPLGRVKCFARIIIHLLLVLVVQVIVQSQKRVGSLVRKGSRVRRLIEAIRAQVDLITETIADALQTGVAVSDDGFLAAITIGIPAEAISVLTRTLRLMRLPMVSGLGRARGDDG